MHLEIKWTELWGFESDQLCVHSAHFLPFVFFEKPWEERKDRRFSLQPCCILCMPFCPCTYPTFPWSDRGESLRTTLNLAVLLWAPEHCLLIEEPTANVGLLLKGTESRLTSIFPATGNCSVSWGIQDLDFVMKFPVLALAKWEATYFPLFLFLHLPAPKQTSCWVNEDRHLLAFHVPPHQGMLPQSQPWTCTHHLPWWSPSLQLTVPMWSGSFSVCKSWMALPSAVSICSNARGASTLWLRGCYPTVQHGCCEAMSCLPLCLSSDAGVSASALTHLMLKHVLCSNHQGISKLREVSGWSLMHTDPGARCVSGWITLPPPSHETAPEPRTLRSRACIYRCDIQCPSWSAGCEFDALSSPSASCYS